MSSKKIPVTQKMESLVPTPRDYSKTELDSSRSENECSDIVESLNAAVLQYLENFGMEESYNVFCQECKTRGIPLPQAIPEPSFSASSFGRADGDRLLELFDKEKGSEMLQIWEKLLEDMEQSEMEAVRTITFYLQIYVAVIPFRLNKSEEEKSKGMAGLREFFDANPDDLAPDENMLSLYALPYISNPTKHRLFKGIFKDPWRNKLRSQVSNVIRHHIKEKKASPRIISCELMQMFLKCIKEEESGSESDSNGHPPQATLQQKQKSCSSATCQTEGIYPPKSSLEIRAKENLKELREQRREIENLKRSLNISEDRYYKLLRVTAEVVNSLEHAVQGKAQDIEELLGRLQSVFPELFPGSEFNSENKRIESNDPIDEEIDDDEKEKDSNAEAGDLGRSEVALQSNPDPGLPPLPHNSVTKANIGNKHDDQTNLSEPNDDATQEEESLDSPNSKRQIEKERQDVQNISGRANPKSRQGECKRAQKTTVPLTRKNDKSKTGIPKDNSLLELLTTSDTEEPDLFGSKPDKKSKRIRSSNLIINTSMTNHPKKPVEKSDESNGVEESTSYINLRRFLKTQPQFSTRSEDHPLSSYQQHLPHTSSTDSWLKRSMLVLDAKQKIDYTAKVLRGSMNFNDRPASPLKLMKVKGHIEESLSPRKPVVMKAQSKGIVRKTSKAQHEQNASNASTNVQRPKQSKKEVLPPEKIDPPSNSASTGRKLATAKKSRNTLQHKNLNTTEAVLVMNRETRNCSFSNGEEGELEKVEARNSKPFRRISRSDSDVRSSDG